MLQVHPKATKPVIKKAIEKLFEVKVKKIRTAVRKHQDDRALTRRYNARPPLEKTKIAYVTLIEGYSLNLFEQAGIPSGQEGVKKVKS